MISSFLLAVIGNILQAVASIFDKSILTKSIKNPEVYAFYSTIFFFAIFLLLPWCIPVSLSTFWVLLLSGLTYGFGIWTLCIALDHAEASHIMPFIGALVAVFTFVLSSVFLGESLGSHVTIGIILLVISSLLLSFEKSKAHNGFHMGFVWGIISGALFAVSHVAAKHAYELYPFLTALVWTKGLVGIAGLCILCLPSAFGNIFRSQEKKTSKDKGALSKVVELVFANKVLSVVGILMIQYAIAIGSVTVVNALGGVQYVFMFIFIYLLTKFKPKLFSEYFTKGELRVETSAIVLTLIGLFFLQ